MTISSSHAAKRIAQLSGICLNLIGEIEEESVLKSDELKSMGVDAEPRTVDIDPARSSFTGPWHQWIIFYSQFL